MMAMNTSRYGETAEATRTPERRYQVKRKRILIVEDDWLSLIVLRQLLTRISHRGRCIGAPFLRKSRWLNGLSQGQGESRCRQSVARRYSNLHASKGARWWARLMAVRSPQMPVPCCWRRRTVRSG